MTPSTLAQLEARLAARLVDAANLVWSTATLDEALRSALAEYSAAVPLTAETVITLPGAGREIALSGLADLLSVSEVWWPFATTGAEVWPPNQVAGFRVYWDDAQPVLFLSSKSGSQPQLGDGLRLWYTKPHTIQNLDSAAITTVFASHESGLVGGAAGYAAGSETLNQVGTVRLDPSEVPELRTWAAERLREFRAWLASIKAGAPTHGEPYGPGWGLDKWDKQ